MTIEEKFAIIKAHVDEMAAKLPPPGTLYVPESWVERGIFPISKPTYLENWPQALRSLSIAQVDVPLTLEEAEALGTNIGELYESFPEPWGRDISGIERRLDEAIAMFPKGVFVRLGSRSPKDAFVLDNNAVTSGRQALYDRLLASSERICDDLRLALCNNYAPHIFVREWIQELLDEPWREFRCFMKDRKLVGISQYYYRNGVMPELVEKAAALEWAIRDKFFPEFRDACHLDDVVFDIFVKYRPGSWSGVETRIWEVKLLEINPFCELTDPCLFCWTNGTGDFDGSFRYKA